MHMKLERKYTWRDLLAMPDDGVERWIEEGELREIHQPEGMEERLMTVRNRFHSRALSRFVQELLNWLDRQPEPHGWIVSGEAGVILIEEPETTVGIDLAYFLNEVIVRQTDQTTLIVGVPHLAVEILSPTDTIENMTDRVALYARAGVPLVWMVNPYNQSITIHALGARLRVVTIGDELACEPHLPGFRCPVARLFS
ncbi:MAG: Uma2 family endonuclease [Gemmataceae bacterium]|nr:Uma2 family endonuclease [Gemmataceae bacterium]